MPRNRLIRLRLVFFGSLRRCNSIPDRTAPGSWRSPASSLRRSVHARGWAERRTKPPFLL